jgi:hypothetical protein
MGVYTGLDLSRKRLDWYCLWGAKTLTTLARKAWFAADVRRFCRAL